MQFGRQWILCGTNFPGFSRWTRLQHGTLGDISDRPNAQDLAVIRNKTRDLLQGLKFL
jgi:hypothetical protein